MALEEKDKLNKLETLKSKLFSKNYHPKMEHHGNFFEPEKKRVSDMWPGQETSETNPGERFFLKTSVFKKFFVFSLIFFGLTLCYAAYFFLAGNNTVSNDNIEIAVLGNNFTAGGEDLSVIISITNRNNSPLDLVDLIIEYPKGSELDSTSNTERLRESLGTIPAGAIRNENLRLVLFGEQGSIRPVKISLEYRVKGSNAIFVKEKIFEVNINSAPINLSVDAPFVISPNQDLTLKVEAALNAARPASKVLVKVDYPVGFAFVKSVPAPSYGNNVWDLGDLAPGAKQEIVISGKMIDVFDGEEKTFKILSGSQSDTDKSVIGVVFNSIKNTVTIKRPFIEANLFVNGVHQREYAIDTKTMVNVEVRYANNLDTQVRDLQIEAKLSGNAFNRKTIITQQGFYDSSRDTIVWNKNSKSQFAEVDPGESGSVTFSFSPLSLFSAAGGLLASPSIEIGVNISGQQAVEGYSVNELENSSSVSIKVISDVGFSAKGLYYSGPFTNSGPIPPKAEQTTTYTIVWTLSSTANNISNARVNATLPPWVTFVGPVSPATEDLLYNSSTKEVVWNAGRIQKGAGITGTARSVAFQVSLYPSLSQVDTSPAIINDAILTAHDDFANVDVRLNKQGLTTQLINDPLSPGDGSLVVE